MAKKILLVDDDSGLCRELAEILRDEGYEVCDTSDSWRAAQFINDENYDLFLFDYKITGLNGAELTRLVKGKDPSGKVFIVSGRPHIESILEKEKVSSFVDQVIAKPFDIGLLLEKIKSVI